MKSFANEKVAALAAYVPGEQPRDMQYIKLNTNESPFPPSALLTERIAGEETLLNLYSDPTCAALIAAAAERYNIPSERLIFTNGSDEILNFALLAFCDERRGIAFPDITYGLYHVLCDMYGIPYEKIPLAQDFTINPDDYRALGRNIIIANPNAPTGLCLEVSQLEEIVAGNPGNVVMIDEAYVAFGAQSCADLIDKYDNLLVIRTFSKSHSLAGARLGMGIGSPVLIGYLNKVRYSFNAYNVNRLTMIAGTAAIIDEDYYLDNCALICRTRARVKSALEGLGFSLTDSSANFLFAKHPDIGGGELYSELKQRGILIRHFSSPRIDDYNRITIGTDAQMDAFIDAVRDILNERNAKK